LRKDAGRAARKSAGRFTGGLTGAIKALAACASSYRRCIVAAINEQAGTDAKLRGLAC